MLKKVVLHLGILVLHNELRSDTFRNTICMKFSLCSWKHLHYTLMFFSKRGRWQESQNVNAFQSLGKWCIAAVGGRGRAGTLLLGNTCGIVAHSPCQFKQTKELEWNAMWPLHGLHPTSSCCPNLHFQMFIKESPWVKLLSHSGRLIWVN